MRLQVVADQAGSKHTGDSRNRGKGGQPVWRVTTPDRRGRGGDPLLANCGSGSARAWDTCSAAITLLRGAVPGFDSLVDLRAMDGWLRCG